MSIHQPIDYAKRREQLEAMGIDPAGADDLVFNTPWIHCGQHGRVHATGWCTVSNWEKHPMPGDTIEAATAAAQEMGLWFYDPAATSY